MHLSSANISRKSYCQLSQISSKLHHINDQLQNSAIAIPLSKGKKTEEKQISCSVRNHLNFRMIQFESVLYPVSNSILHNDRNRTRILTCQDATNKITSYEENIAINQQPM